MRSLPSRFSDWVVAHPVLWGVGLGVVLVLIGFALNLAPIVVIARRFRVRCLDRNRGADGQCGHCENDGVMTSHENLRRTVGDAEIRQTLREFWDTGSWDYRPVICGAASPGGY